ncbi:MAG: cyclic nucleotide-binding domain-containing protein [Polyangiaceae bacterium]
MPAEERSGLSIERQLFLRSWMMDRPLAKSLSYLTSFMREAYFPAGSVLFREGASAQNLYFIMRGELHLVTPGEDPFRFSERSVIGIIDLLQDRPHTRTAVAVTDVSALVMRGEDWLDVLEDNFDFARSAIVTNAASLLEESRDLPDLGLAPVALRSTMRPSAPPADGGSAAVRGAAPMTVPPLPPGGIGANQPLDLVGKLLVLRSAPALSMARIQALTLMAEIAEDVTYEPGETIFSEGETPGATYFVARGRVELVSARLEVPVVYTAGSVVGGYAALAEGPRSVSARALDRSTLLVLRNEELYDLLEDHFELARSLIAYMAGERSRVLLIRATQLASSGTHLAVPGIDLAAAS